MQRVCFRRYLARAGGNPRGAAWVRHGDAEGDSPDAGPRRLWLNPAMEACGTCGVEARAVHGSQDAAKAAALGTASFVARRQARHLIPSRPVAPWVCADARPVLVGWNISGRSCF